MSVNREQAKHVKALGWNPKSTYSVSVTDVWISKDAQIAIGRQVKALCVSLDLPYSLLRESLVQELYWDEQSGRLACIIHVQGSTVESIHLEIPKGHWGFRNGTNMVH